jgi:hypothetical protein
MTMTSEETIALAEGEAAELAVQAAPEDLLVGAVDPECGPAVLADLLVHELVASHRLMQRIAAATDGGLKWSQELDGADGAVGTSAGDSAAGRRLESGELAAARLAGAAGRLMEQVRLGLVALKRCRPALADEDEGIWLGLSWNDERCSQEELERRAAEIKAARAEWDPPQPKTPPLSPRAEAVRAAAMVEAAALAKEAGVADLAVAATAEGGGLAFLTRLLTFELGAIHDLAMRLAGSADRAFDRAVASEEDPAVALQLAAAAARLGDRFRRGLLTLQRLNGGPDKPRKVTGLVWGGPVPVPSTDHGSPANDTPDQPATAPAAAIPAGHGVHRPDSRHAARPGNSPRRAAA